MWQMHIFNESGERIITHNIHEDDIPTLLAEYRDIADAQQKPVSIQVTQTYSWDIQPNSRGHSEPVHLATPKVSDIDLISTRPVQSCDFIGGG